MESYQDLLDGHKEFLAEFLNPEFDDYRDWAKDKQAPKVMAIACCDSRMNPAIITHSGLGEIFAVNNVANIVPPYSPGKNSHHSTSSAIQFAVQHLGVEHIIIMGHSNCGGIRALVSQSLADPAGGEYSFIHNWIDILDSARQRVEEAIPEASEDDKASLCEKEGIKVSLENLSGFPWVKDAIANGKLQIHGWHFNVSSGKILAFDQASDSFKPLIPEDA